MSDTGMTTRQLNAARMIAMGISLNDIAEELQVNRSTIYRWRSLPHFSSEVSRLADAAQQKSHECIVRDIAEIKDVILSTLIDVAQNDGSGSARVSAARVLNEMVLKAEDISDVEDVMQDQSEEIREMLQLIHIRNTR